MIRDAGTWLGKLLVPTGMCDVQFVFNPTTPGDKLARFNVSAPHYGPLPVVLSGTALDPTCSQTTIGTALPYLRASSMVVWLNSARRSS